MKVFIIILNWNGKEFIFKCLDSVLKLKSDHLRLSVVVVDNASTDDSDKIVEERYKGIKILRNQENLGFSGGNNVGIRYALENGADYVLILNPDTIVDQNLAVQLIKVAEKDARIGMISPKIYFAPGYEYHKVRYSELERGKVIFYAGGEIDWENVLDSHRGVDEVEKGQYDEVSETDFATGCAMLVKREVLEKVGVFDPKYFLYREDNDLCQRAKKAGYKVVYAPGGKVWHLNASSSVVGGDLHDYYLTRNRLLFGLRYAPLRTKLALLRESFKILISGRKWQKIGVFDFYRGKFGRGSYSS